MFGLKALVLKALVLKALELKHVLLYLITTHACRVQSISFFCVAKEDHTC